MVWGNAGTDLLFNIAGEEWACATKGYLQTYDKEFTLYTEGDITLPVSGSSSKVLDYIYIQKTGEAPTTMPIALANEYNTFSSAAALDFTGNADVEAYAAKMNAEGTVVMLTKVDQVPANTGVILKKIGENTTATVSMIASAAEIADNQMKAVTTPMDAAALVAENAYVLSGDKFAKVAETATGSVPAGKAYLSAPATTTEAKLSIVFDNATGVNVVEAEGAEAQNAAAFNLAGQRVSGNAKGIVIINGKKYIK